MSGNRVDFGAVGDLGDTGTSGDVQVFWDAGDVCDGCDCQAGGILTITTLLVAACCRTCVAGHLLPLLFALLLACLSAFCCCCHFDAWLFGFRSVCLAACCSCSTMFRPRGFYLLSLLFSLLLALLVLLFIVACRSLIQQ
jgi:hypothetical protein